MDPSDSTTSHANHEAPTIAAFSPASSTYSAAFSRQRQTVVIHKKSPLLLATPPQVTRALAYSHPFLLPLNKFVGLLSWTTADPWESFLLLAGFWAVTLYGESLIRWTGPPLLVALLILGMYARRFSPLSSTSWASGATSKGQPRKNMADNKVKHQKSLDEIVETVKLFTSRCNILLDPFLRLTDFLSTQQTATSASTGPALMTLFTRILIITPVWCILALHPVQVVTPRRVILTLGTFALSWHSSPARASRTILWRSRLVRHTCRMVTGLHFTIDQPYAKPRHHLGRLHNANDIAAALAASRTSSTNDVKSSAGVRFTFALYENQRRWLGIGWTSSMLGSERGAWTDDQLATSVSKEKFVLPAVEGVAQWQWVPGGEWIVDGSDDDDETVGGADAAAQHAGMSRDGDDDAAKLADGAWVYYDNKWQDGRRRDGWSKYTRRRKWRRDAELVESTPPAVEAAPADAPKPVSRVATPVRGVFELHEDTASAPVSVGGGGGTPGRGRAKSGKWPARQQRGLEGTADRDVQGEEEDGFVPMHLRGRERGLEADWGVGEDVGMELG